MPKYFGKFNGIKLELKKQLLKWCFQIVFSQEYIFVVLNERNQIWLGSEFNIFLAIDCFHTLRNSFLT